MVNLDPVSFRDNVHGTNISSILIGIDGGGLATYDGTDLVAGVLSAPSPALTGTAFAFQPTSGNDFYLASLTATVVPPPDITIPEPSSLALFGIGLLGLGMMRCRRRPTA